MIFDDDNMDRERRLDRDFEREPALQRRVRRDAEQLHLRSLKVGFRPSASVAEPIADCPPGDRCYACDARAIGTRDRRPEGGKLERACVRHADDLGGGGALTP